MKINSVFIIFIFILLATVVVAKSDEMHIEIKEISSPNLLSVVVNLEFSKEHNLFYWKAKKSMYPIIGHGLNFECIYKKNKKVLLSQAQHVLPKFPVQSDMIKTSRYTETFQLNVDPALSKNNEYVLKANYNTEELTKYPGGKDLDLLYLESNELKFRIK